MRCKLLILIAMMVVPLTSFSQVYEVPFGEATGTLVRWWRDSTMVVYVDSLGESRGFLLYTQGQPVAQFADIPASVAVHDMRIVEDEVYFCGTKLGVAVVGSFQITNVFAGIEPIHYSAFFGDTSLMLTTEDFKRLEVFQHYGVKVMALVGETMMGSVPNTTVASVYQMASNWYMYYLYNKDTLVRYTDITCLDDMMVAAGTRADHRGCCFRTFYKTPFFPSNPIVTPPEATEIITGERAVKKVLVRQISDNRMAVSYHGGENSPNTWLHDITMSPVTGQPTAVPMSFRLPPTPSYTYGMGWNLQELACRGGNVYILENGAHAGLGIQSWIQEWDPVTALPVFRSWKFMPIQLHSADVEGLGGRLVTSGEAASAMLEIRGAIDSFGGLNECNTQQQTEVTRDLVGYKSVYVVDDVLYDNKPDVEYYPEITTINVSVRCR